MELNIWKHHWKEMQHFLLQRNNHSNPSGNQCEMNEKYDALISFLNPTMKTKIINIIKNTEPPETLQQLSRIPYPTYKELTKLELTYITYYDEKQIIQNNRIRHCPTCRNTFNSLTRLTTHRKNTILYGK